jgi:hypothetical protein
MHHLSLTISFPMCRTAVIEPYRAAAAAVVFLTATWSSTAGEALASLIITPSSCQSCHRSAQRCRPACQHEAAADLHHAPAWALLATLRGAEHALVRWATEQPAREVVDHTRALWKQAASTLPLGCLGFGSMALTFFYLLNVFKCLQVQKFV